MESYGAGGSSKTNLKYKYFIMQLRKGEQFCSAEKHHNEQNCYFQQVETTRQRMNPLFPKDLSEYFERFLLVIGGQADELRRRRTVQRGQLPAQ